MIPHISMDNCLAWLAVHGTVLLLLLAGCGEDMPPPEGIAYTLEAGEVILRWQKIEKAESYKVYRGKQFDGVLSIIGETNATEYIDEEVSAGETYFYMISGVNSDGAGESCVPYSVTVPSTCTVTDLRRGIAVAGAALRIEGDGFLGFYETDSSGRCFFEVEHDGIYTISASKNGYVSGGSEIDTSQKHEFQIYLKPIPKDIGIVRDDALSFQTPRYVVFSTDGDRAYVTNQYGNSVSEIDTATDTVLKAIDVGEEPLGLAVNPRESYLYVVNHLDGTISVIDTSIRKVVGAPVEVGRLPTHAVVNGDGTELYVVNAGEDSVSVVKLTEQPYESHKIDVGRTPYGIAISNDGKRLFVTNESDDTVSIISLSTGSIERIFSVSNTPKDIAYIHIENPDGDYVLTSSYLGENIAIFNMDKASPEMHKLGLLPSGIAIVPEPDGSHTAYIALKAESIVRLFDFTSMQIVNESIATGASPVDVTAHPIGDKIYVVNSDGNSITVLGY